MSLPTAAPGSWDDLTQAYSRSTKTERVPSRTVATPPLIRTRISEGAPGCKTRQRNSHIQPTCVAPDSLKFIISAAISVTSSQLIPPNSGPNSRPALIDIRLQRCDGMRYGEPGTPCQRDSMPHLVLMKHIYCYCFFEFAAF